MKMRSSLFAVMFLLGALAHAEDLTTRDGTVYKGYKVLGHDAAFLTIMYADGGAKVPLSQLPDDLQKKYGYNPATAVAAAQAAQEQDRKDRQALKDEEIRQQAAAAAGVPGTTRIGPSVAELTLTDSGPDSGPLLPPPPEAMNWPSLEALSASISDMEEEIAHLEISMTGGNGSTSDHEKLGEYQEKMAEMKGRFHLQERFVDTRKIAGPVMSSAKIQAAKSELVALQADVAKLSEAPVLLTQGELMSKTQRTKLLALELKCANMPQPRARSLARSPHTWEDARVMVDRRVRLFDEIALLMINQQGYKDQIETDQEADQKLQKEQQDFETQLWAHQLAGFKMTEADLSALRGEIATTEADQAKRVQGPQDKASAHAIFADKQALWLMNLKLRYADKGGA